MVYTAVHEFRATEALVAVAGDIMILVFILLELCTCRLDTVHSRRVDS